MVALSILWREGDLNFPIVDHKVYVHLFGAVTSQHYALTKVAVKNTHCYGKNAAQSLTHHFYVDDLLKSVRDTEYAPNLIVRMQKTCEARVSI